MDDKLKEVVKKYYETKCYAIIDKHFKENYPPEILTELHVQIIFVLRITAPLVTNIVLN